MLVHKLLIANREEAAIRVARSAADFGVATVGVYSQDDAAVPHRRGVDDAQPLTGRGPTAYRDAAQLIDVSGAAECDAVHPGYGFLSANASFARATSP